MLRDVISSSGLAGYAEVGLLIFFFVFVGVAFFALRKPKEEIDAIARLPLDDDAGSSPIGNGTPGLDDPRRSNT